MSDSAIPWTVSCQASLSMEFFRQDYWSGLSFPSPGKLPNPGIKPRSPALQVDSLPSEPLTNLRAGYLFIFNAELKTDLGKREKKTCLSLSSVLFLMQELDSSSVRLEAVSSTLTFNKFKCSQYLSIPE